MNFATRIEQPQWELATGSTYMLTCADFEDGLLVTDPATGEQRMTGACPRGDVVTVPLNTPLCCGCDAAVPDGYCYDCATIHTDIVDMNLKELGDGRFEVSQ